MATPAQSAKPGSRPGVLRDEKTILANQSNAQHSPGPVTAEGKVRVSRNAAKLGLLSANAFVRADEQGEFAQFKANYTAELCPQTPLEETLACEIVHAGWWLRRCAEVETNPPDAESDTALDRLQASVDRARASAHRSLHRSLAELRCVQTERVWRAIALPSDLEPDHAGQADCRRLDLPAARHPAGASRSYEVSETRFCKTNPIPARATRPCGSRENHARSRTGQALSPPVASLVR